VVRFGRQEVLRDITLSIPRGQTVAIIGESGCGKTVLMKSIIGLIRPTSGQIRFDNHDLAALSDKELTLQRIRFGYVFQNAALFDSMTVGQNVSFPLRQHRQMREPELQELVLARLAEVGLPDTVVAKKPAELSGGMRKRVGLARALILNPELVLYDEPTTGLDPIMSDVINELILTTRRNHPVTSIVVTTGSKIIVAPLAGSYERDVIRPHVLGRFEDMVLASAKHPAMLVYLDNFQSIGPSSRGANAGARNNSQRRGLNENYARELLELHTLGVNGGYTQQDVQELAKILTGWTIDGLGGPAARLQRANQPRRRGARGQAARREPEGPITFDFVDLLHEPGAKTVLGQRYQDGGIQEGERVIRALCRHPSTAQFVATKLVTHFVSDEPPRAAVERIAKVFRSTDGDLKAVARALVDEPEAWREDARKFRTPQDWFVAVLRAFGASDATPNAPVVLRQLRQPVWSPAAPKGFGDTLTEWADPDSLLNRGELARTIARLPSQRGLDPRSLAEVVDVPAGNPLHALLADTSIPAPERVALAVAGPAFQWR
jgi:uncharacterized protein (DUF1800 family)